MEKNRSMDAIENAMRALVGVPVATATESVINLDSHCGAAAMGSDPWHVSLQLRQFASGSMQCLLSIAPFWLVSVGPVSAYQRRRTVAVAQQTTTKNALT